MQRDVLITVTLQRLLVIECDLALCSSFTSKDVNLLRIGELRQAASYTWKEVDPSIFGTLVEQALDPEERKRLGAHYTPRAYVERLVVATIIEPLREDWRNVQAAAETLRAAGDLKGAAAEVQAFHEKLCETKVLDPACGTGNFLYVSLELMNPTLWKTKASQVAEMGIVSLHSRVPTIVFQVGR